MAQPDLESFTKRGLLLKTEVTEGTDAAPVVATDGILLMNGSSGTEFDKVDRPIDRPFFGGDPFTVSNKRAFIEGDFEVFTPTTPGTDSSAIKALLLAAGMAETLNVGAKTSTYNPASTGLSSATAYWWHVDAHKRVLGSRANISNLRMMVGQIFGGNVRIQGSYDSVTEEALPTNIVLPSFVPPPITSDNTETLISTVGGSITDLLLWGKELRVDFGNQLGTKEYTSKKVHSISDRQPTFTLRIARADLSDINPWTLRDAGTLITAQMTQQYADPGLYAMLAIRGQIENISEVDIDGDLGWELTGPCIPSDTGGDEFYIELGDSTP